MIDPQCEFDWYNSEIHDLDARSHHLGRQMRRSERASRHRKVVDLCGHSVVASCGIRSSPADHSGARSCRPTVETVRTTARQLERIENQLDLLLQAAKLSASDDLNDEQRAVTQDIAERVANGQHNSAKSRAKQWLEQEAGAVPPKVVAAVIASILV